LVLSGSRGGINAHQDVLAGLNASVRAELDSRFSEMDLSQKELMQQLQDVKMQISAQVKAPHEPSPEPSRCSPTVRVHRNQRLTSVARGQDSLSALLNLRNELDALTSNATSAQSSQDALDSDWSFFTGEVEQAGALFPGLDDVLAPSDDLQATMDALNEQISTLASAVKDYAAVTDALQVFPVLSVANLPSYHLSRDHP
jgi:hypothetical protein